MKKLIIAALLVVGIAAFAQNRKEMGNRPDRSEMEKFSPEQRTQLMVKKLTLDLDLNAKQQEEVKQIIADQEEKREAMRAERKIRKAGAEKLNTDEQFAMQNKMLDEKIAMKNKMKTILSPEQFEKWNDIRKSNDGKFQDKYSKRNPQNCPVITDDTK
jgi:hypothetical protein